MYQEKARPWPVLTSRGSLSLPLVFGRAVRLRALGRGHSRTAHRQAREPRVHHLLDYLLHNVPCLSVA